MTGTPWQAPSLGAQRKRPERPIDRRAPDWKLGGQQMELVDSKRRGFKIGEELQIFSHQLGLAALAHPADGEMWMEIVHVQRGVHGQ